MEGAVYHNYVANSLMEASAMSIPRKGTGRKYIAGLKMYIAWSWVWMDNGCPNSGLLLDIKQYAKRVYKASAFLLIRLQD